MKKRWAMNKKKSRKLFRRTATRTKSRAPSYRGGERM